MSKRNLLLCFDAFGTLFTPKRAVHLQYAEVAKSLGMGPFDEASVKSSFKEAYSKESEQNPNFGKASGMNAEQWWTNIIHNTFKPLLGQNKQLPKDLVPLLLHRFWSEEGYKLMPDVQTIFQKLRSHRQAKSYGSLVVGVVTNSDDRVPDVLSSLGLHVSSIRYGSDPALPKLNAKEDYDIEFSVMSFDVGHEKPDPQIFKAAEQMLKTEKLDLPSEVDTDPSAWQKIYIGDEYSKDVVGPLNAGWNAVLIAPHNEVNQHSDVEWLDDEPSANLLERFDSPTASVGFSRLGKLADWLPKEASGRPGLMDVKSPSF